MELNEYAQYVLSTKSGNFAAIKARRQSYVELQKDAAAQYKQQLQQEGALIKHQRHHLMHNHSGNLETGPEEERWDEERLANERPFDETEEEALERTQSLVAARLQREQQRRRAKGQDDDHIPAAPAPTAAVGAASPFNKMLHVNVTSHGGEGSQAKRGAVEIGHRLGNSFTLASGAPSGFKALQSKASSCKLHPPSWLTDEAAADQAHMQHGNSAELHHSESRKSQVVHYAAEYGSTGATSRRAPASHSTAAPGRGNRRVSTLDLHGLDVALASVAGLISPGSNAGSPDTDDLGPRSLGSPNFTGFPASPSSRLNASFTGKSSPFAASERSNSFLKELTMDASEATSSRTPPSSSGQFGAGKAGSSPRLSVATAARGRRGVAPA